MTDDNNELKYFSARIEHLCSHVSVRNDEGMPYLLALGLKGIHTLNMRRDGPYWRLER